MRVFASTWCAYAGFYFCRKAFFVVKGPLSDALGIDTRGLGEIGTAYLLAYAIGQFVNGALGSRLGARVLLLAGMAVSLGTNVVFGSANGYWTLFAFMVVNGLAQATGWPSVVGTLGHWTRRAERGTIMGIWGTCYQLGGVLANAWAAYWLGRSGWRSSFFAAASVLLVVWFIVLAFQRNRPEDLGLEPLEPDEHELKTDDGAPAKVWTRVMIFNVVLLGTAYLGVKFVRYALWSWAPYFLQKSYGLAGDDAGYLSTLFDVAGFLGVVTAGFVTDRFTGGRRAKVALVMLVGMAGACGLLYAFGTASATAFAICLALVGFMLYGPDSLLSGAGAIEVGSVRTGLLVAALINGMGSVGAVIQELVVARAYEQSGGDVGLVFAILFGAAATSGIALGSLMWRNRHGRADL
jgi:sugar phosphate permease